jgi:hypothetical protein
MRIKYWMTLSVPLAAMLCQQTATAQQDNLLRYISCHGGNKFGVVEFNESTKGFVRSVKTSQGSKEIVVLRGVSLHIAYAKTPFVNFKVEQLEGYALAKQSLIDNLSVLAKGTQDMKSTTPQESLLDGFDVYSIERTKLSGGVQSMYLLFRDSDETVVTLYILNTPREDPQFSTVEEYFALAGEFVQAYTSCVDEKLK